MYRIRGFTLIELIIVLVMLGAFSLYAAPKFFDQGGFNEYAFHKELITAIRYAQKTAVATGCDIRVIVDSGTDGYALYYQPGGYTDCGATENPVPHPLQSGNFARAASAQEAVDVTSGLDIVFDPLGGTPSGGTVTFSSGRSLAVEAETGYVH